MRHLQRRLADAVSPVFWVLARLVPVRRSAIVVRGPSLADDQSAQTVEALLRLGLRPTWLISDTAGSRPVPGRVRVLRAGSVRGLFAYLRAGVVLHTHGISFEADRRDARRVYVNLWHGMPVKRLESDTKVARFQSDVSFATSALHRHNLAITWGEHVAIHETGLPRNDVLLRPPAPAATALAAGRPLVVWLPTFREVQPVYRSTGNRMSRLDGTDHGNVAQLPGADADRLERLARSLGLTLIIKPHPMAADVVPDHRGEHVRYLSQSDLDERGVSLYELLAAADVLLTDYSSVWIDFLLTGRPMVFTAADREAYASSRGFYPDVLRDLPGPVVTDIDGLAEALGEAVAEPGLWSAQRTAALDRHHRHHDARSADRVAAVTREIVRDHSRSRAASRKVRSFDVFDTVLTRRIGDPEAVYSLLSTRLVDLLDTPVHPEAFTRARIDVERDLRRPLGRHATLLEIHREVARRLSLADTAGALLAEAEEQVEREVCIAVPGASALVAAARDHGEVIFVSDSPHREQFLWELLRTLGVAEADDRVFASAHRLSSKSDGGLFAAVRAAVGADARFSHVGDNRRSDVAAARDEGWQGEWRPAAQLNRYEHTLESYAAATSGASSWLAGASRVARLEAVNADAVNADVAAVAAGVLGPMLVGYAVWVAAQARRLGVRRLYFVARDGQVMLDAARHVLPVVAPDLECRYLYGSRQAWVFGATTFAPETLDEWVRVKPEYTPRAMLARVGIDPARARALTDADYFTADRLDRVLPLADRERLRALLGDGPLTDEVRAFARVSAQHAIAYLRQEGVVSTEEPVALVDAGWNGATARALDVLVQAAGGRQAEHLFMGMLRSNRDPREADGVHVTPWLFDGWADVGLQREIVNVNVLVEMLCAGTHGRTLGYLPTGTGDVEPVLAESSNTAPLGWGLEAMQRVAVRTAELAAAHLEGDDIRLDWAAPVRELMRTFWMSPSRGEAVAWGQFPWEDEVWPPFRPIAESVTARSVLTRVRNGDRSLRPNNTWRAGTARRSRQPWRGILQARAWQEAHRDRLRRLPRRARLEWHARVSARR